MVADVKKFAKIAVGVIVIAAIAGIIYLCIPIIRMLCTDEGRAVIDSKVKSFGAWAPLALIGIEVIQVVAAFIPGAPVDVMSGVLFGGFWGIIWCFIGIFIGTVIVFCLVRKFGRPLVYKLFPKEKIEGIRILGDEKKLIITTFILFVIPGTPKDFLTYIAGLTNIKPSKFFITAAVARVPAMSCSVLMGANLGEGRFLVSFILFAVILAASAVGFFVKKRLLGTK